MFSKNLKNIFTDIKNVIPIIFVSLLITLIIDYYSVYIAKSTKPRLLERTVVYEARMERRRKRIDLYRQLSRWLLLDNKEGYESYSKCIKQGYPNKFCLHVPVEACIDNCNFKKWKPKY